MKRLLEKFGFAGPPAFGPVSSLNDFFDMIVVLNLDRRPDRLTDIQAQQDRLGFVATRQAAVDGTMADVQTRFAAYQSAHVMPQGSGKHFEPADDVLDHDERIRQEELSLGRASMQSAGAWAYMETQAQIIERAIDTKAERLLLLDDDALFHKNFYRHFNRSIARLPDDWKILQLGTLRYDWRRETSVYHSRELLQQGRSIGSHAVGLSAEVLPELLELVRKMDAPFDVGALSTLACSHKTRSFICMPQLCVQSFEDTDIQSAGKKHFTETEKMFKKIRWNRDDFIGN